MKYSGDYMIIEGFFGEDLDSQIALLDDPQPEDSSICMYRTN